MLHRTLFSEEHELYRDQGRRLIEREITPHHAKWEKEHIVPRQVWLAAGEAGLLLPRHPRRVRRLRRGTGFIQRSSSKNCTRGRNGTRFFVLHSDIVAPYILAYGPKSSATAICRHGEGRNHRRNRHVGAGRRGRSAGCADDGPGAAMVCAQRPETFITNGQNADLVIAVAKTDPAPGQRDFDLSRRGRGFRFLQGPQPRKARPARPGHVRAVLPGCRASGRCPSRGRRARASSFS